MNDMASKTRLARCGGGAAGDMSSLLLLSQGWERHDAARHGAPAPWKPAPSVRHPRSNVQGNSVQRVPRRIRRHCGSIRATKGQATLARPERGANIERLNHDRAPLA